MKNNYTVYKLSFIDKNRTIEDIYVTVTYLKNSNRVSFSYKDKRINFHVLKEYGLKEIKQLITEYINGERDTKIRHFFLY